MKLNRNSCLLLIVPLLSGCNTLTLVNAVSPDRHYELQQDLNYGKHPRQKLDLAMPRDARPSALIVFFYGGAWTSGRRQDYRFVIDSFAKASFAGHAGDLALAAERAVHHRCHGRPRAVQVCALQLPRAHP